MPDDDWALGQNEVDVRNEARRFPGIFACASPEDDWIADQQRSQVPHAWRMLELLTETEPK